MILPKLSDLPYRKAANPPTLPSRYRLARGAAHQSRRPSRVYSTKSRKTHVYISASYQSRLERGATKISLELLVKIAEHLSLSPGVLINGAVDTEHSYLSNKLVDIMKNMDAEKTRLVYEIAAVIASR